MIGDVFAVDPSINSAGAALFRDDVLIAAGRVKPSGIVTVQIGVQCLDMAVELRRWLTGPASTRLTFAFEWPQIYRASKSKGNPNDLIGIAGVGSILAGMLVSERTLHDLRTPTPAEWIGQCPKVCPACHGLRKKQCKVCEGSAWKTPRGKRIRSRLTAAEIALVPDQNDAIDAVGIGLFVCGRLELRRVYPGAI